MRTLAPTLMLSFLLAAPADAEVSLDVGSKVPALTDVEWIQGQPVTSFGDGSVYVLDFWATWCGPCIASIPHLNELHEDYEGTDVSFVGVAIWPRDGMVPTADFVADKGDDMAYRIAEDIDGATAEAFMEASGSRGIPTAMIVDRDGELAWIGHPMDGLDEALEQVADGTFDREAFLAERAAKKAAQERFDPLYRAFREARSEEDWERVAEVAEEITTIHAMYAGFAGARVEALAALGRTDELVEVGREVLAGPSRDSAGVLNAVAWSIVAPERDAVTDAELDVALLAAARADELTGHEDPNILDTLARVHFRRGNVPMAVALQKRALERADERQRPSLQSTLEEYEGGGLES